MDGHNSNSKAGAPGVGQAADAATNGAAAPEGGAGQAAQPGQPAGIFSSPDMTVETENLPPELGGPQPEEANRAKVAGVFGKRSTARGGAAVERFRQMQAGVAAAENPVTETVTGDVILPGGEKKKRKKWPIVLGAVAVSVAAGFGVFVLLKGRFQVQSEKTTLELFEQYVALAQLGPENLRGEDLQATIDDDDLELDETGTVVTGSDNEQHWFLFNMNQGLMSTDTQNQYVNNLVNQFDEVYARMSVIDVIKAADEYRGLLSLSIQSTNVYNIGRALTTQFLADGAEATLQYVENTFPTAVASRPNSVLEATSVLLVNRIHDYMQAQFEATEIALANHCITDGEIDLACGNAGRPSDALKRALEKRNKAAQTIAITLPRLEEIFVEQTEKMHQLLKEGSDV